jgi:threonine dehydratase
MSTPLPSYDDVAAAGRADRSGGAPHAGADLAHRRRGIWREPESSSARTSSAMGAFKFRGAFNRPCRASTPRQRQAGVVAFSSGNHAQAITLTARLLGNAGDHRPAATTRAACEESRRDRAAYGRPRWWSTDRYRGGREAIGRASPGGAGPEP